MKRKEVLLVIAELTSIHWIYLLFIIFIIVFMICRIDTTILCLTGIFLIALNAGGSLTGSIISLFTGFLYAISELLPTILIISLITAMSKTLTETGINDVMIRPAAKLIRTPALAYWTTGILMFVISLFFWPSPAVALIGAVILPAAVRAGLPTIGVAVAMNLFGHGLALSGDFIIQAAPKLTADAAGIPVRDVVSASIPLVFIMGSVTTVFAFILLKKDMKNHKLNLTKSPGESVDKGERTNVLSPLMQKIFAVSIPLLFLADVIAMYFFRLQGNDATALVGGTAMLIFLTVNIIGYKMKGLKKTTKLFIEGFQFGFKVFGPVIPIAAFFYLGDAGFITIIGDFLPESSHGIVYDVGIALANTVPLTKGIAAVTLTAVGAITGLDGSGFSGISLAGSVAALFSHASGNGVATLTALGQVSAIWVGGGTLIPWALIPAAAICNVDPFELARRNLLPVCTGLIITTVAAVFFI